MSVFSLSFIFMFLPLTLLVFRLVTDRYRSFVLLVASLAFIAMTTPVGLAVMLVSLCFDYLLARPIALRGQGDRRSRAALYLVTVKNILLVVAMSVALQLEVQSIRTISSLWVTVYAFTSLGYVIDLYNGEAEPISSIYDFLLFCCFFGKLHIGPIVSVRDFYPQLRGLRPSLNRISEGCVLLCHGFAKKVILADGIWILGDSLKAIPYMEKTVAGVWLLVMCYLFATYFTLSGYSDVARGLGELFGITLPENFRYPLQSSSVTDFFSNFNISANRFVRKYVYAGLGAEDNGALATTVNIMLITMLMGLWYGVSLNLLVWGSLLGLAIVLETQLGDRLLTVPILLRRATTLAMVTVSFAIFCGNSLSQSWFYLRAMFGLEHLELFDERLLYLLTPNYLLLTFCVVFSTSFFSKRGRMLKRHFPRLSAPLSLVSNLVIFVLSLSFMI